MISSELSDEWSQFWGKYNILKKLLARSLAVNVNEKASKTAAAEFAQEYFRKARPSLKTIGLNEKDFEKMDGLIQKVLMLSNGNNSRNSYKVLLSEIASENSRINILKEKSIGLIAEKKPEKLNQTEQKILETLRQIVPTAALSYEQACKDLSDQGRVSFRGVAGEFRECLREVLDHLAPDKDVQAQRGFELESGQKRPTMKQKVKFIMAARGQAKNAIDVPENALDRVDESLAKLTRSVYNRSSISAHLTASKSEVKQMKMYVETVLAELLALHREG